jgi:hypothetical protein
MAVIAAGGAGLSAGSDMLGRFDLIDRASFTRAVRIVAFKSSRCGHESTTPQCLSPATFAAASLSASACLFSRCSPLLAVGCTLQWCGMPTTVRILLFPLPWSPLTSFPSALYPESMQDDQVSLTTTQKIAFIVTGVVYTVLAIAALMGLIGAIGRKRGLVATYSTFMWFHLAAQVAVGAFFIYSLFQNNPNLVNTCKEHVSDDDYSSNESLD